MSTLVDTPEYTANEVYQIAASDYVEGAQSGASFSGVGVDNEPHQQLANRTAFLKQRQDTNVANIGVLQAFAASFISSMAANGYFEAAMADVNLGAITVAVQFGQYSSTIASGNTYAFNFPTPFANACVFMMPAVFNPNATESFGQCLVEAVSWSKTGAVVNAQLIGGSSGPGGIPGFVWIAIGY